MEETTKAPAPAAPAPATNRAGLTKNEYKGLKSTLCPGCGHDSITNHIISACYDLGIDHGGMGKVTVKLHLRDAATHEILRELPSPA